MEKNFLVFKATPSVVEADKESEIVITSHDGPFRFFDDVTYDVQFYPMDESDVERDHEFMLKGFDKARQTCRIKPQNGELHLKYFFKGEQEWRIHISTQEYKAHQNPLYEKHIPHWNALMSYPQRGIDVKIYSLLPDLYERRVLCGDLHVHTMCTDGSESPELVAASYRKVGRDFLAITDHNLYNVSAEAKEKLSFVKNFKILHGEEVHNTYLGYFHMVNIGSNYSVNDIFLNDPERVEREAMALGNEIEVPDGLDRREYLYRAWIYREIKRSGGYAIFPHPYWNIGYYHTSLKMSRAIIKNGLCDAFEVMGGNPPKNNNLQLALWGDVRAEGCDIPIVGSTDSHSVSSKDYTKNMTVVFTKDDDIIGAVDERYSVAVEAIPGETTRVYGNSRLVLYTHFLLENYFPYHSNLCNISGQLMQEYVYGDTEVKEMIEKSEQKITKFENEFFGR